jgi:hypothetical protein
VFPGPDAEVQVVQHDALAARHVDMLEFKKLMFLFDRNRAYSRLRHPSSVC